MSCEIEPFKQAYIARNFDGVKLFADEDHLEDKGQIGETFCAVVEFIYKYQPKMCIFENVQNAPWPQMQRYVEGRLPLWGIYEGAASGKKGGDKKKKKAD